MLRVLYAKFREERRAVLRRRNEHRIPTNQPLKFCIFKSLDYTPRLSEMPILRHCFARIRVVAGFFASRVYLETSPLFAIRRFLPWTTQSANT